MFLGYQKDKVKFYTSVKLDKDLYNLDKIEETDEEYVLCDDEYVLKTDEKAVNQARELKIEENDTKRDTALLQGVEYKDVLFDSDTDQKVNLLAIVATMSDEDTIIWYGMDNKPLECNKQDLINIGGLITQLHSFCWNKNALIKAEINNASTVEEVEAVEIDYTFTPEAAQELEENSSEEE